MKTTYGPIRVTSPGRITFDGGRMNINGWTFDLNGRPVVHDWQRVYGADMVLAVSAYIAARAGLRASTSWPSARRSSCSSACASHPAR